MASRVQHVCVSLSGGGHRAALFGAGALLYLMDADKGAELSCVASVSGGSLTNAAVEQRPADNRRRGIPRASPAVDSSLLDEGNGVVSAAYDRLPRVWRAGAGNSDVSLFPFIGLVGVAAVGGRIGRAWLLSSKPSLDDPRTRELR